MDVGASRFAPRGASSTRLVRRLVFALGIPTRDGQLRTLLVLVGVSVLVMVASLSEYERMPVSTYFVSLLLGSLLLRFWPQLVLVLVVAGCVAAILSVEGTTTARTTVVAMLVVFVVITLGAASRRRGSLPSLIGESMLIDLRDRLRAQGELPALPPGWYAEAGLRSAEGAQFAGDFLVAARSEDGRNLEVVVVDVSGKGMGAGTRALLLSGAFGGLLGALPSERFLHSANSYLLRQNWDEGFATAVHVVVNLVNGGFVIRTAGHPPVLQWRAGSGRWQVHRSSGPALGVVENPEFEPCAGRLDTGDAMLLYTDGMVESRRREVSLGIDRLIGQADAMVGRHFDQGAARLLDRVGSSADDRAVVLVHRR